MIKGYSTPSPQQLRRFFHVHGISGSMAAGMAGLSGNRQVRKYTGGQQPRSVSFPLWWTWSAYVVLDDSELELLQKNATMANTADTATPFYVYFILSGFLLLEKDRLSKVNRACVKNLNL